MTDNTITNDQSDFNWFKNNGIYMPMINDTGRNVFYKAAIEQSVRDRVVCDIGTGTGLLSILAAKAGAAKVYAVEMDPGRADYARRMFAQLGLSDKVEVINDNFFNTDITADIYVSETIGSQIFNENIIPLSEHIRTKGGTFLPGSFEVVARVYENHPIFAVVQEKSDAFEFQPDIEIDPKFEAQVNQDFQAKHSLQDTLYAGNVIHDFFQQLRKMPDIQLKQLYESAPLVVDLNSQVNKDNLRIAIPHTVMPPNERDVCVVLFWQARYQDLVMESVDCIWGHVSKIILPRVKKPGVDIETWYDHSFSNWRFNF
jgi:predicted RNA methylase